MASKDYLKLYYADVAPLKDGALFAEFFNDMGEDRKRKIIRAAKEDDKRLLLGAGVLLDIAIREEGMDPRFLTVKKRDDGKPYVAGEPFFFNLSHSGERVMCAISSLEVGCDVEKVRDANMSLAGRFFSGDEYNMLKRCPDYMRPELFTQIWTVRESAAKLTGEGIKAISRFGTIIMQKEPESALYGLTEAQNDGSEELSERRFLCKTYLAEKDYAYSVSSAENIFPARMVREELSK